jgi:hypothetical protein
MPRPFDPGHPLLTWLLSGDVAIQYQVWRDLLGTDRPDLQARIAKEGWGAALLAARHPEGHWGDRFYQPKWTSSHYTLLDLKTLAISPSHPVPRESVRLIARTEKHPDGGIGPGRSIGASDVCVNGMFLNYASYFGEEEPTLQSIVDFLIGQHMGDGGFNCRSNRSGARHSSLHSTLSVLEGIHQYKTSGYRYRLDALDRIAGQCVAFLLLHRLFKSDRTGAVIRPEFLKLPFPRRWRYATLRALDCLAQMDHPWDDRLQDAVDVLLNRRRSDGRWMTNAAHPGAVHLVMDRAGQPGRWNTLIALRVLAHYDKLPEAA